MILCHICEDKKYISLTPGDLIFVFRECRIRKEKQTLNRRKLEKGGRGGVRPLVQMGTHSNPKSNIDASHLKSVPSNRPLHCGVMILPKMLVCSSLVTSPARGQPNWLDPLNWQTGRLRKGFPFPSKSHQSNKFAWPKMPNNIKAIPKRIKKPMVCLVLSMHSPRVRPLMNRCGVSNPIPL